MQDIRQLHDYLSFTMTALSNIWGFYNPSSASPVYIWGPITLSADVLARNGARPSAGTVLTEKTNKHVFFQYSLAFNDFMTRIRNGDVIRSDHGIPRALPVPTWKIHLETSMIHWGRDKIAILQMTFQIHFKWKKCPKISPENIPGGLIDDTSTLVRVRAWRRPCNQSISKAMLTKYCDAMWGH